MSERIEFYQAKSILTKASGYISEYDYTISPFVSCLFDCSYCYVPTLAYSPLPSLWGKRLRVKENAVELLTSAARRGKLDGKRIFFSPNTDPFTGDRRCREITLGLMKVFAQCRPALLVIQTRSASIAKEEQMDVLREMKDRVVVAMSVTTDNEETRKRFEPACPQIEDRVSALAAVHREGIRTQASLAPLLPCNPGALAELVDPHSSWVTVQPLKMGAGARTRREALKIVRKTGLEGWLQGGRDVTAAMSALRARFGERYHEGREGFSMKWAG